MTKEKTNIYAIKKEGSYLSEIFSNIKFSEKQFSSTKCYWYHSKLIAQDIAKQLGANVVSIRK